MYVCMHVCIYACMDIYICVQMYICMYMYICEHAYFWDEQKGEERKTPGCRLAVGRPRALKPFPTARPSPAPLQPSLHPPSPRFGQCTNMTDTLMLRCATLGSTLCCWPNLQPVDGLREPKRCQSFSRFPPAVLLPQTSRLSCMSLVRVFHEHLAGENL